jgi:hypothetical protein
LRPLLLALAFSTVIGTSPAYAQDWVEHQDLAWGFSINFPHTPVEEDIEYTGYYDHVLPGRTFSASSEQWDGEYSLTVVSHSTYPTDAHTAIHHAAQTIRDKGEVLYDSFQQLDAIPGQILTVRQEDGRLMQACVYFVDQRLFIAEGSVSAGNPAPSNFQQTISILDRNGERLILDHDD